MLTRTLLAGAMMLSLAGTLMAAPEPPRGPFDAEAWPPTIVASKKVHFISVDNTLKPPSPSWLPNLKILTGGDHPTEPINVGGHDAVRIAGMKFNTADDQYTVWAEQHSVDVLLQFYGDGAHLDDAGKPKYFNFLTGTLPEPIAIDGGEIPRKAKNNKWNWVLFRVQNGLRHMDGGRLIGTIHPKAKADPAIAGVSKLSGQNGGTIRLDGLHDLKVRVVAFGEKGAFGSTLSINKF